MAANEAYGLPRRLCTGHRRSSRRGGVLISRVRRSGGLHGMCNPHGESACCIRPAQKQSQVVSDAYLQSELQATAGAPQPRIGAYGRPKVPVGRPLDPPRPSHLASWVFGPRYGAGIPSDQSALPQESQRRPCSFLYRLNARIRRHDPLPSTTVHSPTG